MSQERDRRGAEAGIAEHCEWVNTWAAHVRGSGAPRPTAAADASASIIPLKRELAPKEGAHDTAAGPVGSSAAEQLARDLADIAQARDALEGGTARTEATVAKGSDSRIVWLPFALRRTADSVPILLGTVLGLLMLVVFSAAAVFAKLAR
jgi:hypothetical protein